MARPVARVLACLALTTCLSGVTRAADPVWASIFESLPEPKGKPVPIEPKGEPVTTYTLPGVGFDRIPAKFNARGIEVDRGAPFLLCLETTIQAPAGARKLVVRSRGQSRLEIGGTVVGETKPISANSSGHESVPELRHPADPRWRAPGIGEQELIVTWNSSGKPEPLTFWVVVGARKLRREPGEVSVCLVDDKGMPVVVGTEPKVEMSDASWPAYLAAQARRNEAMEVVARREASRGEAEFWKKRHELARKVAGPSDPHPETLIDREIDARLKEAKVTPAPLTDDASFFRRMTLDTVGVVPTPRETAAFLADSRPDKRSKAIDARLADPRWADHWMGYWQDVLAENPGILKPTLNNTGPFRRYLERALRDNLPLDRLATDLVRMEGSVLGGGPAGFSMASQNDAPYVAKAHILAKAFLAAEMKCARCHDAPAHPYDQSDLFALAGLLEGKAQKVPASSTVRSQPGGRTPAVSVTLKGGDVVAPGWKLPSVEPDQIPDGMLPPDAGRRERLAALLTSPTNTRFAPVAVNRVWRRYMGVGIVEPVDDWDDETASAPSHPRLLDALAKEFVTQDYDLKHVARLILNSKAYQRQVKADLADTPAASAQRRLFASPGRRRMSAEQLLDSLYAVAGKTFRAEEQNLDPDGRRPPSEFLNLGVPAHAWQFTSTSNERDRPALSLPVTQGLVDVLVTFGWRAARPDPITVREEATTPLQPAILANGVLMNRIARISDDSAFADLCVADRSPAGLIRDVYLRVLSREPSAEESERLVTFLAESYADRIIPGAKPNPPRPTPPRRVSWSNHLSPEATTIQLEMERLAHEGDPPSARLTPEFRERMEDVVWALVNSPEFLFIP